MTRQSYVLVVLMTVVKPVAAAGNDQNRCADYIPSTGSRPYPHEQHLRARNPPAPIATPNHSHNQKQTELDDGQPEEQPQHQQRGSNKNSQQQEQQAQHMASSQTIDLTNTGGCSPPNAQCSPHGTMRQPIDSQDNTGDDSPPCRCPHCCPTPYATTSNHRWVPSAAIPASSSSRSYGYRSAIDPGFTIDTLSTAPSTLTQVSRPTIADTFMGREGQQVWSRSERVVPFRSRNAACECFKQPRFSGPVLSYGTRHRHRCSESHEPSYPLQESEQEHRPPADELNSVLVTLQALREGLEHPHPSYVHVPSDESISQSMMSSNISRPTPQSVAAVLHAGGATVASAGNVTFWWQRLPFFCLGPSHFVDSVPPVNQTTLFTFAVCVLDIQMTSNTVSVSALCSNITHLVVYKGKATCPGEVHTFSESVARLGE